MDDITAMYDFIERVDLEEEFLDAMEIARQTSEYAAGNDIAALADEAVYIYPKLRFIFAALQRYKFASRFINQGDYVVDVPCGTGYGTSHLASAGNTVLGIDIDPATIELAADRYKYPNISFVVGDMLTCKLPEADVIVCLEGLEHVSPGERLIERFVGALSDNGRLIISVPINEDVFRPDADNPYHEEEYDVDKLSKLLEIYFGKVVYFGGDNVGSVSSIKNRFDGVIAVCEV